MVHKIQYQQKMSNLANGLTKTQRYAVGQSVGKKVTDLVIPAGVAAFNNDDIPTENAITVFRNESYAVTIPDEVFEKMDGLVTFESVPSCHLFQAQRSIHYSSNGLNQCRKLKSLNILMLKGNLGAAALNKLVSVCRHTDEFIRHGMNTPFFAYVSALYEELQQQAFIDHTASVDLLLKLSRRHDDGSFSKLPAEVLDKIHRNLGHCPSEQCRLEMLGFQDLDQKYNAEWHREYLSMDYQAKQTNHELWLESVTVPESLSGDQQDGNQNRQDLQLQSIRNSYNWKREQLFFKEVNEFIHHDCISWVDMSAEVREPGMALGNPVHLVGLWESRVPVMRANRLRFDSTHNARGDMTGLLRRRPDFPNEGIAWGGRGNRDSDVNSDDDNDNNGGDHANAHIHEHIHEFLHDIDEIPMLEIVE